MFGKKSSGDTTNTANPGAGGSVLGSTTVAWNDADKQANVMWKVPRLIRLNDNIVVREDEIAVFYRDGKVLTYFDQPNRYALTDFNAPVVGKLLKSFTGVQQQAEVYYLQKRFMDGKFGSTQPYQFADPTFGIVNLRIFGEYRWRVSGPENFINQFVGTFSLETSDAVEARLREQMVILIYNALGKMKGQGLKVTDLAANLMNIEQVVLSTATDRLWAVRCRDKQVSRASLSASQRRFRRRSTHDHKWEYWVSTTCSTKQGRQLLMRQTTPAAEETWPVWVWVLVPELVSEELWVTSLPKACSSSRQSPVSNAGQ